MKRRLPHDALQYYYELGVDRSYEAVAAHYGVSKATVVRQAKSSRWQDRLRELEEKARQAFEKKVADQMEAVRERQLKAARALQSRAIELLMNPDPATAVKAAPALGIGWKHELLLLGDPTERSAVDIAALVERESKRWLVPVGDGKESGGGDQRS